MSFLDAREHGSKAGGGGVASAQQEAIDRRERLRRLALETIDLAKDPYYMRNHLGQIECRLCLTLHNNEGNYLAHTQGKRHQQNLAKRAAREAAEKPAAPAPQKRAALRKSAKIGRPGYRVTKQFEPEMRQRSLLFQVEYPEIEEECKPRYRFMSAYEQRIEITDKNYMYLCFAAEPYEVIAFKVPNQEVDKTDGKIFTHWDPDNKIYSLQYHYRNRGHEQAMDGAAAAAAMPPPLPGPQLPPSLMSMPFHPPPGGPPPLPPPPGPGGGPPPPVPPFIPPPPGPSQPTPNFPPPPSGSPAPPSMPPPSMPPQGGPPPPRMQRPPGMPPPGMPPPPGMMGMPPGMPPPGMMGMPGGYPPPGMPPPRPGMPPPPQFQHRF
eukprot:gene23178-30390_t